MEREIQIIQTSLQEKFQKMALKWLENFPVKHLISWGPLKLVGGINKGRPNSDDLKNAENFIKDLVKEE